MTYSMLYIPMYSVYTYRGAFERRDQDGESSCFFIGQEKWISEREINTSMGERFCQLMYQEKLITAWWGSFYSPDRRGEYQYLVGRCQPKTSNISIRAVVYSWTTKNGFSRIKGQERWKPVWDGLLKGTWHIIIKISRISCWNQRWIPAFYLTYNRWMLTGKGPFYSLDRTCEYYQGGILSAYGTGAVNTCSEVVLERETPVWGERSCLLLTHESWIPAGGGGGRGRVAVCRLVSPALGTH